MKAAFQKNPEQLKARFLDNLNAGLASGMSYREVLLGKLDRLSSIATKFTQKMDEAKT